MEVFTDGNMLWSGEIIWEGVGRLLLHCTLTLLMKLAAIFVQVLEGLVIVYVFLSFVFGFWLENVIDDIDGEVIENDTTLVRPEETNHSKESVNEKVYCEETDFIEGTSLNDEQQTSSTIEDTLNVRGTFISSAKEVTDVNPSMTSEQDTNDDSGSEQARQCPALSAIPRVDERKQIIRHSVNIKDEMVTFSQQSQLVNIVKRRRQGMQQQNQPSNQPLIRLTETTTIISQHPGPNGDVITRRTHVDQQSQLWSHALPNRYEQMNDKEGIDQQYDNTTERQTLLHSEESKNVQGLKQQDNEESRSMQDSIQDRKNIRSSRLHEYTEVHNRQHDNDLENITDHHETWKHEKEIVPLHGKPQTGIAGLEKDHSYTLEQESEDDDDDDDENRQCNHPYEAHKHRKIGNSLAFKDEISSVEDNSNQQLCYSQDTVFIPLIKEEMEDVNYSESHDSQTLLQPCDEEREDIERPYSEWCSHSKEEMEIPMHEMKEETNNQNWIERHDSKVNVEESCAWKEHMITHRQRYEEETKDHQEQPIQQCKQEIEDPYIQSFNSYVKDTIVLPSYPEIEKEDKEYFLEIKNEVGDYIESHTTKVEFNKIPDEISRVVLDQSYVEDKHNDKEQHKMCEQEIEELRIKGQSEVPDTEEMEGFAHSIKQDYHECIEPHDTKEAVEETHGKKGDTAVNSQPCEEETDDIGQKCEHRSQPFTQESKDTENVVETPNLEHQLPRSPRVEIVCRTKITMKRNHKYNEMP